jgi:hypothetical protein
MHIDVPSGPLWFLGRDFLIDLVSIIVLLFIGFFSWKYYSMNRHNKKHLLMFSAFAVLGVSFLFKIATYFILYSTNFQVQTYSLFGRLVYYVQPANSWLAVSFVAYAAFMLTGFFLLYMVYEGLSAKTIILMSYLLAVSVLFSVDAYIFMHITAFLLTLMITLSLWKNYRNNRLGATRALSISFGVISASIMLFILAHQYSSMYVVGELVQLAGYIILLGTFIMVLKHGKKTGKAADN